MGAAKRWWIPVLAAALLVVGACTDNDLDESDANVVLEVISATTPAVTGQVQVGQCQPSGTDCLNNSDCPLGEFCDLPINPENCQIPEWNYQFRNEPLNEGGSESPFNDVEILGVTVQYLDAGGGVYAPNRQIPIGVTIQAGGTGTARFPPIAVDDISVDDTTVTLVTSFVAQTASGQAVTVIGGTGALLTIEDCLP